MSKLQPDSNLYMTYIACYFLMKNIRCLYNHYIIYCHKTPSQRKNKGLIKVHLALVLLKNPFLKNPFLRKFGGRFLSFINVFQSNTQSWPFVVERRFHFELYVTLRNRKPNHLWMELCTMGFDWLLLYLWPWNRPSL